MPIYEFVCQSCGNEFENIQSFSDSSVPACVKCHSTNVERRMGRPAIHFKGSGWYINDSKKSNDHKNGAKSASTDGESKPESAVESKAEGKSESTTESKSDAPKKSESSETTKSAAPVAAD